MNTKQKSSRKKIILTFGIIGGVIVSFMLIGGTVLWDTVISYDAAEYFGYASMIIAMSTIYVGIKKHRDTNLGGIISFGKAFKTGLLITIVTSLIYVITWMIISQISPGIMDEFVKMAIEKIKSSGKSPDLIIEEIEQMNYYVELYKNPFVKFGMTLMEILPVGLLITLISSFILKKK